MIKLNGENKDTLWIVDETDIIGLHTYDVKELARTYYSIIVKGIHQWLSVDAETFFKVKALLENRIGDSK